MGYYLFQGAYTPEAWAAMVKNPQNRIEAVRPAVERLGGKVVGGWYAFGEYDVVAIFEFPNNVNYSAIALTFAAGGALKTAKTTVLMTGEEAMEAMRQAQRATYRPPS